MSSTDVLILFGIGFGLAALIGLWARAWHRRPLVWALITFFMTPFGFMFVVLLLLAKGPSRKPEPGA